MDFPTHLFHYTSLEVLALILKYRTIRLNKLTKTDDLEEGITKDAKKLGRFVYVSCWTDSPEESIPLWHMYSNRLSGVRVKLPIVPFRDYKDDYARHPNIQASPDYQDNKAKLIIHPDYILNQDIPSNVFIPTFVPEPKDILFRVQYTNEHSMLCPKVVIPSEDGSLSVLLGELGKCKRECWGFQREWRYILMAYPINIHSFVSQGNKAMADCLTAMLGEYELPDDFIDLGIDDQSFVSMEITTGPGMSPGQQLLVESIVEKYNPDAKILKSELSGKIYVK